MVAWTRGGGEGSWVQLNSGCIWVDLLMDSDGERCQEKLVCQGKLRSSQWDMLEVQLLIVEYTGLSVRGGIQVGCVQVLRVINLYLVFGTIRRDGISLRVSAGRKAKRSGG